ncbi:MAG: hypothetical protein AVDCRST_MAG19-678, partial [uncultured Thermomicrobiales bacterium]
CSLCASPTAWRRGRRRPIGRRCSRGRACGRCRTRWAVP